MAAGDLITVAWQIEARNLLIGDGTVFVVREFAPWSAPVVRQGETGRPQAHGSWPGRDWLGERRVTAKVAILATTAAAEQVARRQLAGVFAPLAGGVEPLVWMEDDGVRYVVFGKPQPASTTVTSRMLTDLRFLATDPRIYTLTPVTVSTSLPVVSGGLVFAASAPFSFGTTGAGGTMAATNAGTIATPWVATFTGPLVAPILTHTGQSLSLSFSGSLAAGETLVVDGEARTVLLNGTASRYSWLVAGSAWFTLDPGPNVLRLGGASGAGSVAVTYRPAWL